VLVLVVLVSLAVFVVLVSRAERYPWTEESWA
jgi:hypothetical protein